MVKADGYGHGADDCAARGARGRRRPGSRSRPPREAERARPPLPERAAADDGRADREPSSTSRSPPAPRSPSGARASARCVARPRPRARRPAARSTSSTTAAWAGSASRDPGAVLALARACAERPRPRAGRRLDPLRDRRRAGLGLLRRAARALRARSPRAVRAEHPGVIVHAANSAAVLREPALPLRHGPLRGRGLRPRPVPGATPPSAASSRRCSLRSYVADVKRFAAGRQRRLRADLAGAEPTTWVGVLPIGYGDGVRRGLSNNAEVLVGGRRYPLVGTVSMDNVTIDLGPETDVEPGDEAVLIGAQGEERILAEEVAARLGTINYEVTCGISPRVPRVRLRRERRRAAARAAPAVARRRARRSADAADAWIVGGAVRDAALGARGRRPRPRRRRRPRRGGARRSPRRRRARLRALGRVRDLAGRRPRRRLAGRRRPRCAARRSRPTSAQRDFTVGAVAVPLAGRRADRPATAGSPTSSARVLRAVGERSFADDPLRLLRAARLAAELGLEIEPATVALGPRRGRARRRAGGRAPARRAAPAGRRPRPAARARAARRARDHRRSSCPSSRRCAGSSRTPTTTSTSTATRWRCSSDCSRSRPTSSASPASAPAEVRGAARRAARRRDDPRRRAALRRRSSTTSASRRPGGERGGFVTFIGHDRDGARDRRRRSARGCGRAGALTAHLQALTLHHLRLGFLVHEAPLPPRRVHEYLRATEPVAADVTLLTVADRLSARGSGPIASEEMVEAHLELAREMLAAALDWRRDGPAARRCCAATSSPPSWGSSRAPSSASCSPSSRRRSTRARSTDARARPLALARRQRG